MIFILEAKHYCYLINLRALEICLLKYMSLTLENFFQLLE